MVFSVEEKRVSAGSHSTDYKASNSTKPKEQHKAKTKSVIPPKKSTYKVFYDGRDVTPKPLSPMVFEGSRERQISVYDMTGNESSHQSVFKAQSVSKFHTQLHHQTIAGESAYQVSFLTTHADEVIIQPEKKESIASVKTFSDETIMDKTTYVPEGEMPTTISLVLTETSTTYLLEIPSATAEKDTDEGLAVDAANKHYEYMTEGKGRNRKVVNAEVQTVPILLKTRSTGCERTRHRHNYAFASNWDMYDTYKAVSEDKDAVPAKPFKSFGSVMKMKGVQSLDSIQMPTEDKQMLKLIQNQKFQEAVCVIERLLANNNFSEQQKIFRGLSDPNPFREGIEYKYRLNLLWTFANNKTNGRCVTAAHWNPANSDILAVGYGKFFFTDRTSGMVLIWNIKNPVQPERTYNFEEPVTTIHFSTKHPNLLGIGFYDGMLRIIDISAREIRIIGESSRQACYDAIWHLMWYVGDDYYKDEEQIFTLGKDGRVLKFRSTGSIILHCTQIMQISRAEGKLQGIETMRRCLAPGISISRCPAGVVLRKHPVDLNIYYVGTNEGIIYSCSRNYYHQHLDLYLAHEGPIHVMKCSPFCDKFLLTCGDDWTARIWAPEINEPLIELFKDMSSVQGADWSPTHSTIVATICGTDICIWDIQRKTYAPQSITNSPTSCRNTFLEFTKNGRCLLVGDIEGNMHLFALDDIPFPAFFQADLFKQSLKRALATKPEITKKLDKLGSFNFDKTKFGKYFN